MALEASSDLLVGQWQDSPRFRAAIDAPITVIRQDVIGGFDRIRLMRDIDHAEGVWLDFLGVRVGIRRPATTDPSQDVRWGFEGPTQSRGWDLAPFAGDEANAAVYPLPDAVFRCFVKARAILDLGDGTFQTFAKAVRCIDPGALLQDRRNMVVRIVTKRREFLELADEIGALPRTAGVQVDFLDQNVFGFDRAGVGFDRGPFRP